VPDEAPIVELLVAFGHELRSAGLAVGSGDVMTYCSAMASLDTTDLADLYWAGRTTMVTRRDQIPDYDRVFRRFFLDETDATSDLFARRSAPRRRRCRCSRSLQPNPPGRRPVMTRETSLGHMASDADIFRNKSFAGMHSRRVGSSPADHETDPLEPAAAVDAPNGDGGERRSPRHAPDDARVDARPRRTGRALPPPSTAAPPPPRAHPRCLGDRCRTTRATLLQFAYSARRAASRVEVFCFGTRLTRITKALARRRPDDAMDEAAKTVFDWEGGTRIGDSLTTFVRDFGRRGMGRGAIVVICSDGLDRGDPAVLPRRWSAWPGSATASCG
jgi:uncharacterized protein with von Willebrand factor type A (vWA) domain